jgi:hypothetical protein
VTSFEVGASVERGRFTCERRSERCGWLLADGTFVPARCGAPNKCAYCAYLTTVENALVVSMDAALELPRVGLTLTTADPKYGTDRFRRDISETFRLLRRRLGPDVGYLGLVEFTTGRAAGSGGHRRIHQHLLLKRCEPRAAEGLEDELRGLWERRTGASRIELRELRSPAGATAYLIHHHRKREQAPPPGWSGKRMRPSKNYYERPVSELRSEARVLLTDRRVRRAARRAIDWQEVDGWPEEFVDDELRRAVAAARRDMSRVEFVKLDRDGGVVPGSRRRLRLVA